MNPLLRSELQAAADGEVTRLMHMLDQVAAHVASIRLTIEQPLPPGPSAGQPFVHAAADISNAIARLDSYRRAVATFDRSKP